MTLLDVKNHLYTHFLQTNSFSLKEDIDLIKFGGAYDDTNGKLRPQKEILLRAALDDMTKMGLLLLTDAVNGSYILTQPLLSANQNVVITPYTAHLVGDAFNLFARETGVELVANKLAINDGDISCVVQVALTLHDRVMELQEELDDILGDIEDDDESTGPQPDPSNN